MYVCSREWLWRRKLYIPKMAWGWVNHGVIFNFGWTIPLSKLVIFSQNFAFPWQMNPKLMMEITWFGSKIFIHSNYFASKSNVFWEKAKLLVENSKVLWKNAHFTWKNKSSHFYTNSHDWELCGGRKVSQHRFCNRTNRKLVVLKVTSVWAVFHTRLHYWQ